MAVKKKVLSKKPTGAEGGVRVIFDPPKIEVVTADTGVEATVGGQRMAILSMRASVGATIQGEKQFESDRVDFAMSVKPLEEKFNFKKFTEALWGKCYEEVAKQLKEFGR